MEAAGRGGQAGMGDGGGVFLRVHGQRCGVFSSLRCSCWLAGVDELGRCLRELREADSGTYRHVLGRYGQGERRRRRNVRRHGQRWVGLADNELVLVAGNSSGTASLNDRLYEDVLVLSWPCWVEPSRVEQGLRFIDRTFVGDPCLPDSATT